MNVPIERMKLPDGCPSDISLWRVHISFDLPRDDYCFPALCSNEIKRVVAFHRTADAARFASTRSALRLLLSEKLGKAPGHISFMVDAFGRPSIKDAPRNEASPHFLDFNVSHSGEYGLIAMSIERRVGVDIQRHTEFDWREVAAVALSTHEAALIDQLDEPYQLATFHDYWSTKEALLKCVGVGMSHGMKHVPGYPLSPGSAKWFHTHHGITCCYSAAPVDASQRYAAQLAWSVTHLP